MSEPTIHMIARFKHNEMRQAAEMGEPEGHVIYVQGWLPRQITRLFNLIRQPSRTKNAASPHDVARNAS
jgi:hypothetical protein